MTQEQKELLLKDLSARLPYGVKFACSKNVYTAKGLDLIVTDEGDWEYAVTAKGIAPIEIDFIKPYLFPLESMSEEQKQDLKNRFCYDWDGEPYDLWKHQIEIGEANELINWFHENHIDNRNLIPRGMAIDATGKGIY